MRVLGYGAFAWMAALLGCSGAPEAAADGPEPLTGRRSFVVTSTIMQQQTDGGAAPFSIPTSHKFTIVLDWDRRTALLGAAGSGTVAPFQTTAAGGNIGQTISFSLGTGATVTYATIDVTVGAAGALTGAGRGQVAYQPPSTDVVGVGPAFMTLAGVPDTEPPTLTVNVAGATIDPFTDVRVAASEPLPPTTRLKLVNLRGESVELAPLSTDVSVGIAAFTFGTSPFRMWRYREQYSLLIDSVADFAGNVATSVVTFTIIEPPPLAAEDGFESAAGTTFAGAQVLSGSGAPTITGARSLYIPSLPTALPPGRGEVTQLALRVALDATDTVVRFSYRSVNPETGIGFGPNFVFGAPGSEVKGMQLGVDSGPPVSATIGQGTVMLGPVMTAELALPPGAASAGELTIIRKLAACCYGSPSPPVPGLILDDLRAE